MFEAPLPGTKAGDVIQVMAEGFMLHDRLLRPAQSRAKLAPFRLYGPTCDSMDAAAGPFMLPADIHEGDLIEIGSLGSFGTAMGSRFNVFVSSLPIVLGQWKGCGPYFLFPLL